MTRHHRRLRTLTSVLAVGLLPLSACAGEDESDAELNVLAAASLTEVFTEMEAEFEKEHDGVDVKLSFGSSTTLAESANDGAPGDVLATADETSMDLAVDGGAANGEPTEFATNALVMVVPAENPANIRTLDDLAGVDWVRCADDVPCGRVAQAVLANNDFSDEAASLEVDVKAVLTKVSSGEADAGFVYATDAQAAGDDVIAIDVPRSEQELTSYFVAPLEQTENADLAADWIELMESDFGRSVLTDAKFGTP